MPIKNGRKWDLNLDRYLVHQILLLVVIFVGGSIGLASEICPAIRSTHPVEPQFNESEKVLICGYQKAITDSNQMAWKEIPQSQSIAHLKALLQVRGYNNPTFSIGTRGFEFDPGPITFVRNVEARGSPDELDISKKRFIKGKPITPTLLSELEDWVQLELRQIGYPCPLAKAYANSETGDVLVDIEPGTQYTFGSIQTESIPELNSQILSRYYPFHSDQAFNSLLLNVAEDRILTEGLVEKSQFVVNCAQPDQLIYNVIVPGLPRVWSFSLYGSTEVGVELSANWLRTRMDTLGSFFELNARMSARVQDVSASYKWYYSNPTSTSALRPLITIRQQDEEPFRMQTEQFELMHLNRIDSRNGFGIFWSLGPSYQNYRLKRGPLAGTAADAISIQVLAEIRTHSDEVFRKTNYDSWTARINSSVQSESSGSDFTAETFLFETEISKSLISSSPPILLGSWRLGLGTVATPHFENLPPTYRQYLGGINSLRGFSRYEVPRNNEGAASRLFNSFELRSGYWSETIYPIAFLDVGWLGTKAFSLSSREFLSPGMGLYWRSPIGPFRVTLAQGISNGKFNGEENDFNQWLLYLSLGERF